VLKSSCYHTAHYPKTDEVVVVGWGVSEAVSGTAVTGAEVPRTTTQQP